MSPTEKRTRLEKRIVHKVVSSETIEVFDLGRGYRRSCLVKVNNLSSAERKVKSCRHNEHTHV